MQGISGNRAKTERLTFSFFILNVADRLKLRIACPVCLSFCFCFLFAGCAAEKRSEERQPPESKTSESQKETISNVDEKENADLNEAISLRYRFKKDQELQWNVLQSQKIITSIKGTTKTVETTSRSTKLWNVIKLEEDGTATFEYSVENVRMKQSQTGENNAQYDSRADKEIPVLFSNLEGMIGVPLAHLTINPLGETKKKIALRSYGAAGEENRITVPLPDKPIAVGEHWDVDMPLELSQPDKTVKKVRARQRFTMESVKTGVARISFVSQILTPLEPKEQAQIIDRYSSGRVVLDIDAGQLISQERTVDKRIVGFQGPSDSIHHIAQFTECCCGLKSCDICSKND